MRHAENFEIGNGILGDVVQHFAGNMFLRQKHEQAELFGRKALQFAETLLGPTHRSVALNIIYLTETLRKMERREEIESLLKRAQSILVKEVGREHADYGVCVHNLAVLYRDLGRYKNAEPLFREALPILEREFAGDLILAEALEDFALFLRSTNRGNEGDALIRRAAKIRDAATA
jgi:tetratricopeptide (TPR) repeat protein